MAKTAATNYEDGEEPTQPKSKHMKKPAAAIKADPPATKEKARQEAAREEEEAGAEEAT